MTDISGVISRFWYEIKESKSFSENDRLERLDNESIDTYYHRVLEITILNYADIKPAKKLFKHLKMDGVFKMLNDKNNTDVIFNNEYIPYRLDLASHSTMGLSLYGGSSSKQLSLAILAAATNDKDALKYYDEFKQIVFDAYNRNKQISYIEIQQWLIKRKRKEMENIVKYVCSELDITQKALSEEIGVSEGTVNRWSAKPDEVPLQTKKTLNLLLENAQLKANQEKLQKAISLLEELKTPQNNGF